MYHISDIKHMERCERMFYLSKHQPSTFIPFMRNNEDIVKLLMEYMMLDDKDCFIGKRNDDPLLALEAIKAGKHLLMARLAYHDLRIKLSLLLQQDNKHLLYFVYQSIAPKESEAQGIADTLWVLDKLNIKIDEIYIISLNSDYVREEQIDVRQLFIVSDCLYKSKGRVGRKLVEIVEEKRRDVDEVIDKLKRLEEKCDKVSVPSSICTKGIKCSYFDECFPSVDDHRAIEYLQGSHHKYDMKAKGINYLGEADIDLIEGFRYQYAQIMADRLGGKFVDEVALSHWLAQIKSPISYLDFEWESFVYPPYAKMKCYDVLVFQYSLHIEDQDELKHLSYIGEGDCRENLIKHLLASLPETGSILVYNMEGAEKLRLMQLAQQFPQYEEELKRVCDRMIDLSLPFQIGCVYDLRMKGRYSLKTLVPLYSSLSYHDLEVSYGLDAVQQYNHYLEANGEEKKQIYDELVAYCGLDTYGEYIVYHALKDMIGAK